MKILLIAYDNDSLLHYFPMGLGYLAAALKSKGHDVEVYQQDLYHLPDAHLTSHLDEHSYDMVGVGVIAGYYQYQKLLKISRSINESKNRPFYVIGGHGPTPEPAYFLKKTEADAVVMGEGEATILELCEAVEKGSDLKNVAGIAYFDKREGAVHITKERPLIDDLDSVPHPSWELFNMDYYAMFRFPNAKHNQRTFPVISGRGCPYKCNFCYRMEKGFRQRSSGSIIDEIKALKEKYHIAYIAFVDELLMSSEAKTADLCNAFLEEELNINWYCNGRLNFASKKVLNLMKKAGCVFINYGIESMDDLALKNMNKNLTIDQIIRGVENTLEVGISPGLNIIFGNIGENLMTLKSGTDFLIKYSDAAQLRTIRPVTPYPGSPLYYYAIEKGLLKDCEDFYERKHLNSDLVAVNFTDLTDDQFHKALLEANTRLIKDYFGKQTAATLDQAKDLYLKNDTAFRGFR